MDERSAELTKYAANAMLATKISFMNELANIAERWALISSRCAWASARTPAHRLPLCICPGAGYGGSCFPKDVQALHRTARGAGFEPTLLSAVESVNKAQKSFLAGKIRKHFGNDLQTGRVIALWGLAFKPNTDDMREAPALTVIGELLAAGAQVQAYDPVAMNEARRVLGERPGLTLVPDAHAALAGADALAIVTEWREIPARTSIA